MTLALPLLVAGFLLHYGWGFAPSEHQWDAQNIMGAIVRAGLVVALVWRLKSRPLWLVAAWWLAHEAMTAGCSALYIVKPWEVKPNEAQCSALVGADLGILGAAAVMLLLVLIYRPINIDR